jgi:hypothetical protein
MPSLKRFLWTIELAAVLAFAAASAAAAMPTGLGPPPGVPGPPAATPGLPNGLPTPVCTPSWGTIVLPICV